MQPEVPLFDSGNPSESLLTEGFSSISVRSIEWIDSYGSSVSISEDQGTHSGGTGSAESQTEVLNEFQGLARPKQASLCRKSGQFRQKESTFRLPTSQIISFKRHQGHDHHFC